MENLFRITDPRGIEITCNKLRWENHVISNKPIMKENVDAVKNTVETPDVIYGSEGHLSRDVYFKKDSGATFSDMFFTKVIVEVGEKKGEVVTAFPKEHIAGNIGELKYVKPKL